MFGDVTSANIVGYTSDNAPGDNQFVQIVPQFVNVSDETKITLKDMNLDPEAYDTIQTFDGDGNTEVNLVYLINAKDKGDGNIRKTGWFRDGSYYVENYDFARGSSFWYLTTNTKKFTVSGAVAQKKTEVTLPGNNQFAQTGNNSPVAIKLADLEFDPEPQPYDTIQTFDGDGNTEVNLIYLVNAKDKGDGNVRKTGWFLNGTHWQDAATYEIPAGKAFWVLTSGDAGKLTIPAPKL